MPNTLHLEVQKIMQWLTTSRRIEDYDGWWSNVVPAAEKFIHSTPPESWTAYDISDLLFLVNLCNTEYLAETLTAKTEIALLLARMALESGEPDARWQLASQLAFVSDRHEAAEALLLQFARDPEEYVSRRALLALATLKSSAVPRLAELAWKTGHEYQRIAALNALKTVESALLPHYLAEAHKDGREHLVSNAKRLASA